MMMRANGPILATIVAAGAWGLFWIPLRAFEDRGLETGWTTFAVLVVPVLLLAPFAALRKRTGKPAGLGRPITGLCIGGAVALYSESVLQTDVARALILFYVTPVWSTALEVWVLRYPLSRARILALGLGVAGLVIILDGFSGLPLPRNPGDVMALLAGALWSVGSLRVRLAPAVSTFESVFAFFFHGTIVAALLILLPFGTSGSAPGLAIIWPLLPWLVLSAAGFLIPVMWGILWGSRHIDAGRLGILLQLEAVVGIASAAMLTNEPFGLTEVLGAGLVIAAGIVDVLGSAPHPPPVNGQDRAVDIVRRRG